MQEKCESCFIDPNVKKRVWFLKYFCLLSFAKICTFADRTFGLLICQYRKRSISVHAWVQNKSFYRATNFASGLILNSIVDIKEHFDYTLMILLILKATFYDLNLGHPDARNSHSRKSNCCVIPTQGFLLP
jgi:hypothetical protein